MDILKCFDLVQTGGGCTALQFVLDESDSIYVTDADADLEAAAPTDTTVTWLVSVVDEDGVGQSTYVYDRADLTKEIEKLMDDYNVFRR